MDLDRWLRHAPAERFPWSAFAAARESIRNGDPMRAAEHLRGIVNVENLETRHHLQAWHILRQLGQGPPAESAKEILGIVVEMGMEKGTDLLAGYADHRARYFNYSGSAIIWEHPNATLDLPIESLLREGLQLVNRLGSPCEKLPPEINAKCTRISFITSGGIYFGEGPTAAFSQDPFSRKLLGQATVLLQLLVNASRGARPAH